MPSGNLSDTKIRGTKPRGAAFKLYDGDNLYLIVKPNGARWWRQRYTWNSREKTLSVGVYPDVSLKAARERGTAIREQVANGIDPSAQRQEEKVRARDAGENTFKPVSVKWLEQTSAVRHWTADHTERVRRRLERDAWPWIGSKPISAIAEDDLLQCLLRVSDRGRIDTSHRLRAELEAVFHYAKRHRLVPFNPASDIKSDDLPRLKVTHNAAIVDPAAFGALLRALDTYPGDFAVRCALKLQALLFVRPGELRAATWDEIDLAGAEWRIPAARMKMRQQHVVPLARQAIAILRELHAYTGPAGLLFPQRRNASRPISSNTLGSALRTLGFSADQQTAHGFRSSASTLLNEQGWNADAVERQLAHGPRDKVRAAYNSAQHLPERKKMMQAWADYLDGLRAGSDKIVSIGRGRVA
jgi:integrase